MSGRHQLRRGRHRGATNRGELLGMLGDAPADLVTLRRWYHRLRLRRRARRVGALRENLEVDQFLDALRADHRKKHYAQT